MLLLILSFFLFVNQSYSATAYRYQYTDDVYQKAKRVATAIRYFLSFVYTNRQNQIPIRVFSQYGFDYVIAAYKYDDMSFMNIEHDADGYKISVFLYYVFKPGPYCPSPLVTMPQGGNEFTPSLPSYFSYRYGCYGQVVCGGSNLCYVCDHRSTEYICYPVGSALAYHCGPYDDGGRPGCLLWRRFVLYHRAYSEQGVRGQLGSVFNEIFNNIEFVRSTSVYYNENYYNDYLYMLSTSNYQNSIYDNALRSRQEYQDWVDYMNKGYIDATGKVVASSSPIEFVTEYPSEYSLSVSTDYFAYYYPRFLDSLNRIENKISSMSVVVNTTANVNVNIDISTTNTLLNNIYNFLSSTSDVDYSVLSDTISVATSAISSIFDSFKSVFIQTSSDTWDCSLNFSSFNFMGLSEIQLGSINLCEKWGWVFDLLRNLLRLSAIVMSFWIVWEGMT